MSAKVQTDTLLAELPSQPLVSVCMITYNHEKFIRQAIESVLHQQTNFQYELIIGEDGSTDNTRLICEEYSMKYSNVRLLPKGCKKGYRLNFLETLKAASGKYVALCEGDDYWCEPQKLQQQFDVLERNAEVIICYHDADILYENGVIECFNKKTNKIYTKIEDVISSWYINTCTIFYRNIISDYPEWFEKVFNTDYALQLLLLKEGGTVYYIEKSMAVYRKHSGGISNTIWGDKPWWWLIVLFSFFNDYTNNKYSVFISQRKRELYTQLKQLYLSKAKQNNIDLKSRFSFFVRFLLLKFGIRSILYKNFLKNNVKIQSAVCL